MGQSCWCKPREYDDGYDYEPLIPEPGANSTPIASTMVTTSSHGLQCRYILEEIHI